MTQNVSSSRVEPTFSPSSSHVHDAAQHFRRTDKQNTNRVAHPDSLSFSRHRKKTIASFVNKARFWPIGCILCLTCLIISYHVIIFTFVFPFVPPYSLHCDRRYREGYRRAEKALSELSSFDSRVGVPDAMNHSLMHVPFHQIKQRGSHNSYHKLYWGGILFPFRYSLLPLEEQLDRGIRHLELDVHHMNGEWLVYHLRYIDFSSHCNCLQECLSIFKEWSRQNPGHFPITLWIEPKYRMEWRQDCGTIKEVQVLQETFREVLGENSIYTPKHLQGHHKNLKTAIETNGWPHAGQLTDKFILIMNVWKENSHCREMSELISFEESSPEKYRADALFFIRVPDLTYHYSAILERDIECVNEIGSLTQKGYIVRSFFDGDDLLRMDVSAQLVVGNKVPYAVPLRMPEFNSSEIDQ